MKLIDVPHLGPRPMLEFVYGGSVRPMPTPQHTDDAKWADYVYNRDAHPGIHNEWWNHTPTGMWLIVQRDTVTDDILGVRLPDERERDA